MLASEQVSISASGFPPGYDNQLSLCAKWLIYFPFPVLSESSGEESTGEREEEISAHDEAASSTKTTEVPAGRTSNTQTGEG